LQKFKFCGEGDCPDFILAIIHSNLCGLSSIKLKVFASHVVKLIIAEGDVDESKFTEVFEDLHDLKSAYLCIRYLLLSAVRFDVTSNYFSTELQQVGLPREHSLALGKVLDDNSQQLRQHLKGKALTVNEVQDVKCTKSENGIDCIKMELKLRNPDDTREINISKSDIPILLKELRLIKDKINEFN